MRRMSAAGAALSLCLTLGGLPALAQSPSPGPSLGAAAEGRTYIVAQDGPGDFGTIGEAVAAASDGDTVLVRPGRYVESVVIQKAIHVEGEGDRSAIVVEGPELPAFHVLADGSSLHGLTLTGGRPRSEFEMIPREDLWQYACLTLSADASATDVIISDGADYGIMVLGSAAPTITGNDIHQNHEGIGVQDDAAPTISGNDIHENAVVGISVRDAAAPTITENVVHDNGTGLLVSDSAAPMIMENEIHVNLRSGIMAVASAAPTITRNDIHQNGVGVMAGDSSAPAVSDNDIHENQFGISVTTHVAVTITGNRIHGNEYGIVMGTPAAVTITGNDIHDNSVFAIAMREGATATIDGREVSGPYEE